MTQKLLNLFGHKRNNVQFLELDVSEQMIGLIDRINHYDNCEEKDENIIRVRAIQTSIEYSLIAREYLGIKLNDMVKV